MVSLIRKISESSCDTEDWGNAENSALEFSTGNTFTLFLIK